MESIIDHTQPLTDNAALALTNAVNLRMPNLFSVKERGRVILGEFLNCAMLSFNKKQHPIERFSLSYELDIKGAIEGKIFLNLDEDIAAQMSSELFGASAEPDDENVDLAMKELLNIFAGHVSILFDEMGFDFDIDIPVLSSFDFIASRGTRKILFRFEYNQRIIQFILMVNK